MDALADSLKVIADWITQHITMWALIATGLFLTAVTRGVQVRHLPTMIRQVASSRSGAGGGISSFQAFAISLAARVGVGNVFGVAAALLYGGPGAVFWMWVVALVGMATAFFEATLAQIFKVRAPDGSFRGGPAFYMARGMGGAGGRALAGVFAVITLVTCGFIITSVQSNAVAGTLVAALGGGEDSALPGFGGLSAAQLVVAGLVLVLTAVVVFGGIRAVARVTEWMAPIMALIYIVLVALICLMNLGDFLRVIGQIISSAFAPEPLVGGLGGGVLAAVINGTKRGLFSNEAGQGTAPNAAATATVAHPVQQGLIQSLGVFVDTIVVCTATALIVLLSGVYTPGGARALAAVDPQAAKDAASTLTSSSIGAVLGGWTEYLMAFIIFVFAYSSLLGNYTYAQVNMDFLRGTGHRHYALRLMIVAAAGIGAVSSLNFVWNLSDVVMGLMAIINIVSIVLLGKWAFGALADWEDQKRRLDAGQIDEIRFVAEDNPHLPGELPGTVWSRANAGRIAPLAARGSGAGGADPS